MLEKFGWEVFQKTGSIDSYLLYRQSLTMKENSGEYGVNQDKRDCDQTDSGKG